MHTKRIGFFLAFVLLVPWGVVLAVRQSGLMQTNPAGGMMLANYIIITLPALANLFTRLVTKEGWRNLWLRPNFKRAWRFYLAAWLLPLLATLVGGGLFYLLFPRSFDPSLAQVRAVFANSPALAAQPWLAFLVIFLQSMTIATVINGIASLGEEFGWRAYLLQKLVACFASNQDDPLAVNANLQRGARTAALLVGLIWGVWHYPLFFLSSSLVLPFALIYLLYTCAASVLLSWLALRSGSVWPAAIGHGMLNATSAFPMLLSNATANPLLGPGPTGLVGMLGYVILALVLLRYPRMFAGTQPLADDQNVSTV